MYTIWSFFIRKKNFSFLLLGALAIAGVFSVVTIQKESNPEVKVPVGIVSTALPGASAADIETLITDEIENALIGSLENVNKITSTSRNGVSSITVEFNANADIDKSIQDLKDRVDTVLPELPEEALDPFVTEVDFSQEPILTFAVAGNLLPGEFAKLGLDLKDELESIPGVSSVSVSGLREREVQVVVNGEALRRYGISLNQVVGGISRSNAELPIGSIEFDNVNYNLQFEANIKDPSEIGDIVVSVINGEPVYVRDVAFVSDGLEEGTTISRVSINGNPSNPALSFNVLKQTGGDVTDITNAVNERLEELQREGELLQGMDVLIVFDTGEFLKKDLMSLGSSGVMAIVLVTLVLLVTIGWREALVAGLSIPISFMIAFAGLLVSGNTINFISLFSLILSVGILVDSAIVITEGIHTNLKNSPDGNKKEAALKTIKVFHTPVTAGTMTTVAVFLPLFFISGIVGEFIKSIPFTVISVLLASLLVALGFVPLISSLVLIKRATSKLEERQEKYTIKALEWYKNKLSLILGNKFRENIFLSILIALFFATPVMPIKGAFAALVFCVIVAFILFYLFQKEARWYFFAPVLLVSLVLVSIFISFLPTFLTMKVEFFPVGDEDYLIVEMELPEGTVLEKSDLEARKIEEILYKETQLDSFVITIGSSSAFSGTGGSGGSKFANAFIQLNEDRKNTSLELGDILAESLSKIETSEIRVTQLQGGPPVGTPVVITFKGDDLDELNKLAVQASRILKDIPGTNAVTTSTKNDNTEFVLTIDKAKASAIGLSPDQIAQTLRTAIQGTEATTINTLEQDIDVIVTLALNPSFIDPHDTNQVTIDAIRNIEIQTENGPVILGSIMEAGIRKGSTAIQHEDGDRIATAQSQLAEGGNVAEINREFELRAEEELNIPEGVIMKIGGETEETNQSFAEMGYSIIAGLILMFAVIVLMFNSFRHAIYVIYPAFFSFIGITAGLSLTGNALSFPSLMGLIALIGIVVNNSIILIDVMNSLRKENNNLDMKEVVLQGSASRLRPILLTTVTTVIGIIPLLFTASFWAPLALSIIFGLSFSVLITLVLIPIIYLRKPGVISED